MIPRGDDNDMAAIMVAADKLKNQVRMFAVRNGAPPWWADIWETRPRPHVHLIAAAPRGKVKLMCQSIEASKALGDVDIDACPVTNINRLVSYLTKEQTTESRFAGGLQTRRIRGSHKLPEGGDRQHISRALETELLQAGLIKPWTKTNARRISKPVNIEALNRDFDRAKFGMFFVEDIPETNTPTKAKRPPQKRAKIPPPSLPLAYPPTIADMLAKLNLTMTDAEIAARLNISRPQATNIRNRQFGPSPDVVRRVLELARAA